MDAIKNLIITNIDRPFVVKSPKGRRVQMEDRSAYGLSFCSRGQITYTMNGKTFVSDRDHAVFLPKGGCYSLHGDQEGLFPLINFQCRNFGCNEILLLPLQNAGACIREFETLQELFLFPDNRLRIYSLFYALLNMVFQEQLPRQNPLYPAIRYLEENISDPALSNARLAQEASVSEVYFRRLFAAQYNTTPRQYILDVRINRAKQLLSGSPNTVTAIAEQCGFASLYHFCRAFRSRTGMTPTEYAARNRDYRI